jgi:hypothetical protein
MSFCTHSVTYSIRRLSAKEGDRHWNTNVRKNGKGKSVSRPASVKLGTPRLMTETNIEFPNEGILCMTDVVSACVIFENAERISIKFGTGGAVYTEGCLGNLIIDLSIQRNCHFT